MSKDIHKEDAYFKKAFENLQERPSPEVWENINTKLDRWGAAYYRKKLLSWKRFACVLIIVSASCAAYIIRDLKNKNATQVMDSKLSVKYDSGLTALSGPGLNDTALLNAGRTIQTATSDHNAGKKNTKAPVSLNPVHRAGNTWYHQKIFCCRKKQYRYSSNRPVLLSTKNRSAAICNTGKK